MNSAAPGSRPSAGLRIGPLNAAPSATRSRAGIGSIAEVRPSSSTASRLTTRKLHATSTGAGTIGETRRSSASTARIAIGTPIGAIAISFAAEAHIRAGVAVRLPIAALCHRRRPLLMLAAAMSSPTTATTTSSTATPAAVAATLPRRIQRQSDNQSQYQCR
ncbi:MAG: hypothetical protein JNG89_02700 [Planctomycetaceae bacterium]|nr:hypothetical protein [Planctomycetaceae bacterium]